MAWSEPNEKGGRAQERPTAIEGNISRAPNSRPLRLGPSLAETEREAPGEVSTHWPEPTRYARAPDFAASCGEAPSLVEAVAAEAFAVARATA